MTDTSPASFTCEPGAGDREPLPNNSDGDGAAVPIFRSPRLRIRALSDMRLLLALPAIVYLIVTTQIPFLETVYYSFYRWHLNVPRRYGFIGFGNYRGLFSDERIVPVFLNTIVLTASVVALSLVIGCGLALLLDRDFRGRGVVRTLLFSPFLVMPVVTAVTWKNMLLDPVYGLVNWLLSVVGLPYVDFFSAYPMSSVIMMITWEWAPFAMLVLLTGLQSLPPDQVEAAKLDGANARQIFFHITLPHLTRFMQIIVVIETIFIIQVFGEIYTATGGGPGLSTSNIPYLLYAKAFFEYDIGLASASAVVAVIVVNIVSIGVLRLVRHGR